MTPRALIPLATALLLSACQSEPQVPPPGAPFAGGKYVAMGSSIAAGPGLGALQPDTPPRCTRAQVNYPSLLAEKLDMTLVDQSCSGAMTSHITGPWYEIPPQIASVTPDVRLVTITIGGNDLNYVGGLMSASCTPEGESLMPGYPLPCSPKTILNDGHYARLERNMKAIVEAVKQRAPGATVALVEYPRLLPDDTLCARTPIAPEDAAIGREIAGRLSAINHKVAQDTGALLIPMHDLSAGHTACDPEPWSTAFPIEGQPPDGAPWHTNRAGMRATAEAIAAALEQK